MAARAATVALGLGLLGCGSGSVAHTPSPAVKSTTCSSVTAELGVFAESLDATALTAKTHAVTYAGLLELLLSFESAAVDLDGELAGLKADGHDLETKLREARASLDRSATFARTEREGIENHAREIAPLAKETQQAWTALRTTCAPKKGPPDCEGIREAVTRFDKAENTKQHDKAVIDLVGVRLATPALAKARDRAVAASKAVSVAIKSREGTSAPMPDRWAAMQKELGTAMDGLLEGCKGEAPARAELVASAHPDPRKLTVLVHVKPPAGVEKSLLTLAKASTDTDERAFYEARAQGAFGSGFFLVEKEGKGSRVLVVTNRHVVELGDRASLELADGTALGAAEVIYSNPTHDLAVLRPAATVVVAEGFAFSPIPAKDQQTVIATGFPGIVGRPSYQTTKGYVSNERFRLDDGTFPLTYVQHTAPIDPGSSGGPLTDEVGRVLGVNTLKVTGREGVGLAVPSKYVLSTLRIADNVESRHASAPVRQKDARLACLGFLAELGTPEPRMLVLEQMISNHLVGVDGLEATAALADEEGFDELWTNDSVRAMRIATLVKLRAAMMVGGGPSVLETCEEPQQAAKNDFLKFRIRLANFETRELALRWEHGRWKIDGLLGAAGRASSSPRKLPPLGPPAGAGAGGKKIAPPGKPK